MSEMVIEAKTENLHKVLQFVDEQLESLDCPMKVQMQVDIAVEEIFVNIAHYAYKPGVGSATIRTEVHEDPLSIELIFIDGGVPYDPLAKEDPDVSLPADQRQIGGLGIFMVKKSMDSVDYEYKDGHNILRIKKNF